MVKKAEQLIKQAESVEEREKIEPPNINEITEKLMKALELDPKNEDVNVLMEKIKAYILVED